MSELQYYIIDTESSGLKEKYHELTEISIIRYTDRAQLTRNIKCKYPERASYDALRITNKKMEDLYNGDEKEDVVNECNKFFGEDGATPNHRVIVGHNIIRFDKKFLHALWQEVDQVFPANLWLDTIELTKTYAKSIKSDQKKFNLKDASAFLGIQKSAIEHTAKADARQTYFLFKNLIEQKNVDQLRLIKTFIPSNQIDGFDMSLLDER